MYNHFLTQASSTKTEKNMNCPSCKCSDIDYNDSSGEAVCTNCGTVLEENGIVSSVEFQESSTGAASVIGQYVSNTASGGYGAVSASGRHFSQESRDSTLQKAKRKISNLAGMMHLGTHVADAAHRIFVLALQSDFTSGRKSDNVVAACLYIICRKDKHPHLLIDFADRLQTNVFTLGSVFLKLCRMLCIRLPIIDPSLYIHRFAAQLQLGNKMNAVTTTALRLVATMNRDWILIGRRPSGICGAALLIAAQTHEVQCSRTTVKNVVQIGDGTLKKRLAEFALTPAAQLSYEEFKRIDFTAECDPPCFRKHQEKKVLEQLEQEVEAALLVSSDEEEGHEKSIVVSDKAISDMLASKASSSTAVVATNHDTEFGFHDEKELISAKAVNRAARLALDKVKSKQPAWMKKRQRQATFYTSLHRGLELSVKNAPKMLKDVAQPNAEPIPDCARDAEKENTAVSEDDHATDTDHPSTKDIVDPSFNSPQVEKNNELIENVSQIKDDGNTLATGNNLEIITTTTEETAIVAQSEVEDTGNLSELDDDEINALLLSTAEVSQKTVLWNKINATYIKEQVNYIKYYTIS